MSMNAGLDRDLHLRADAVIRGDENRIDEARGFQVEQAAEAADLRIRAGPARRAHLRLDQLDHAISGIDIDAGIGIGEPLVIPSLHSRVRHSIGSRSSPSAMRLTVSTKSRFSARMTFAWTSCTLSPGAIAIVLCAMMWP